MPNIRIQRMEKELLKLISNTLHYKLRDNRLHFVTITAVTLSNDMSYTKIYFTNINKINHSKMEKILTKSSGFIKKEIAASKMLRIIPELHFIYDSTEENAHHLDDIFQKIHSEQ